MEVHLVRLEEQIIDFVVEGVVESKDRLYVPIDLRHQPKLVVVRVVEVVVPRLPSVLLLDLLVVVVVVVLEVLELLLVLDLLKMSSKIVPVLVVVDTHS